MTYNLQNYNAVKAFLDQHDFKYTADGKKGIICMGINIPGKVRNVKAYIDFAYEDCYIVVCFLPNNAPKQRYSDILHFINYINYNAKFGSFEMDEEDGEIRYRMTVDCEDIMPSSKMIEKSIYIPATMLKKYGEYMIDIIMEYKTYEDVRRVLDN
mgnify:CR=1 FL=1